MPWLRHDDQRCLNRKIGQLTDVEYRALDALHEFVARSKSSGTFALSDLPLMVYVTPRGPRRVTQKQLNSYVKYGLVDIHDEGFKVHDWDVYQPKDPTAAQRMQRYRDRNADRNDTVTDDVTESERDRDSRARSRPVPSPTRTEEQQQQVPEDVALDVARAADEERGDSESAAAEDQEPPADLEVTAVLEKIPDAKPSSLKRVLPLARQLPRRLFEDVVAREHERARTGKVGNRTGNLVTLLKEEIADQKARAAAANGAASAAWTLADSVAYRAATYARSEIPWDAARELLELQIEREGGGETRGALLQTASAAYQEHVPEPTVGPT